MCRRWTWPCLRAAFKLPVAKRPSCPAPSPPVLPSTISTSSGWWSRCPTPTNQSRYCKKHTSHIKKKTPTNPDLRFVQKSVYFQVFFCSLRDSSIRWAVPVPVPHGSVPGWLSLRFRPLSHSSSSFGCVIPFELVNMQLQATQAHLPPFTLNSALVGRANNTISFCTNYLMPTTGSVSQLFSLHSHARTRIETNREEGGLIRVLNFSLTNPRKETVKSSSEINP